MSAAPVRFSDFPLAARYGQPGCSRSPQGCSEAHDVYGKALPSERHIQCVWADPTWRPKELRTTDGEGVIVLDPGQWNLEAGPDFLNAVLEIGPDRRRLQGDVEVHVQASDWDRHRHADNPVYAGVVAHVVYAAGSDQLAARPRGGLCIPLRQALKLNPVFTFEAIDLAAYPYDVPGPARPCADAWRQQPPEQTRAMLEAAGQFRLWRKAVRMASAMADRSPGQALYEETLAALGYKHNKIACRTVASLLPLDTLRALSDGDSVRAYALLLGVAGMLPVRLKGDWDIPTRRFVRQLWDRWWKMPVAVREVAMTPSAWRLSGVRPQNHPRRRLAAAAALFGTGQFEDDLVATAAGSPRTASGVQQIIHAVQARARMAYWTQRLGFSGQTAPRAIALIGDRRAADIWINVLLPFLAAHGEAPGTWLAHLPAGEDNAHVRRAAHGLLGRDHNPALLRRGLVQQGLMQILCDYCVHGRLACRRCVLAQAAITG